MKWANLRWSEFLLEIADAVVMNKSARFLTLSLYEYFLRPGNFRSGRFLSVCGMFDSPFWLIRCFFQLWSLCLLDDVIGHLKCMKESLLQERCSSGSGEDLIESLS